MDSTWRVLPHDPLQEVADGVLVCEGALPKGQLRRRATIVRMASGDVCWHNPMALDDASMARVEALGPLRYLLVPNGWHRLDAPMFKARYPEAAVLCPAGARKRVSKVVEVAGSYDDFPDDARVSLEHLDGAAQREGVMIIRAGDVVLLAFNDMLWNQPHLPGFEGWVIKVLGSTGGPRVTRIGKMFLVKDKAKLRAHLARLADTPSLARLVIMHGHDIVDDPAGTLRAVAAAL